MLLLHYCTLYFNSFVLGFFSAFFFSLVLEHERFYANVNGVRYKIRYTNEYKLKNIRGI